MSDILDGVLLSPEDEAERLWKGAQKAFTKASECIADLSEAVDLGARAVEIMVSQRLQAVRSKFPPTISCLIDPLPPEVDPSRDAIRVPNALRFIDVLDMLSAEDLTCISPHLHHGWEDHVASCRHAREHTREATGISLDVESRNALMLIAAYRNRIFLVPPPVRIVPKEVIDAFPALVTLAKQLFTEASAIAV
jgi:hypothetical protein